MNKSRTSSQGNPAWRRSMTPTERLKADVEVYSEAVIYALGAAYEAMEDVQAARSISRNTVLQVLRRSSSEALLGPVLRRLVERKLIRVGGMEIYFLPALLKLWAEAGSDAAEADARVGVSTGEAES